MKTLWHIEKDTIEIADYLSISLEIDSGLVALVEQALLGFGAISISIQNGDPGQPPSIDSEGWLLTKVNALLPEQVSITELRTALAAFDAQKLSTDVLREHEWQAKLIQSTPTLKVGCFAIHGDDSPETANQININLSAGLAFGTGEHETTVMCLEWLSKQEVSESNVLDLGCGSGILAIGAAKLAARSVTAIDNDPDALDVALENAQRNGVDIEFNDHLASTDRYEIVVANIYATELIRLADLIQSALSEHGALALSGILVHQYEEVVRVFAKISFEHPLIRNGWVLLAGTKR